MSVVELLTEIGSMVCGIALNKKMSRKVIKHILHKNSKVNIENDDKNTLDNSNAKTTYLDNQIQVKETNNNLNISAFNTLEKPPSNYNEEQARKIKFEKLALLSEWVDSLPAGATPEYN